MVFAAESGMKVTKRLAGDLPIFEKMSLQDADSRMSKIIRFYAKGIPKA